MKEITVGERIYFGVIAVAALFVSYMGFLRPADLDETFTWAVLPPLHAGFVAALYLFGGVYMVGCLVSRHARQVRPAFAAVVIFTGFLLLITLLNPDAFDYSLLPVWVWTLSYIVYPLIAIGLGWRARARLRKPPLSAGPSLPRWTRGVLVGMAVVFAVGGVALLVFRDSMVDWWPWAITAGLAQFYGGPFLAIAYCSWMYSRARTWTDAAPVLPAMLAFVVATLVVSIDHRSLFSASDSSAWIWFGFFGAASAVFLAICVLMLVSLMPGAHRAGPESALVPGASPQPG